MHTFRAALRVFGVGVALTACKPEPSTPPEPTADEEPSDETGSIAQPEAAGVESGSPVETDETAPADPPEGGGSDEAGGDEAGKPSEGEAPDASMVKGALDSEQIRDVVSENTAGIRACYDEKLAEAPDAMGRVSVKFTIGSSGAVTDTEIKTSEIDDEKFERCLSETIAGWVFPAPRGGGVVVVSYPFNFQPAG